MEAKVILGEEFNIVVDYLWAIGIGTILIGLSYIAKAYFDYKNTRFQTLFTLKENEYNIMKTTLSDMRNIIIADVIPILKKDYNECTEQEILHASKKIHELYTKESRLFESKNYLIRQASENRLIALEKEYRMHLLNDITNVNKEQKHSFLKEQHIYYSNFSKSLNKEFKIILKKLSKDLDISK